MENRASPVFQTDNHRREASHREACKILEARDDPHLLPWLSAADPSAWCQRDTHTEVSLWGPPETPTGWLGWTASGWSVTKCPCRRLGDSSFPPCHGLLTPQMGTVALVPFNCPHPVGLAVLEGVVSSGAWTPRGLQGGSGYLEPTPLLATIRHQPSVAPVTRRLYHASRCQRWCHKTWPLTSPRFFQ